MKKLLLLLGCISLAACLDTSAPTDTSSDPTTESFAPSLGVNIAQMQKVAVGNYFVWYKDLAVGTGAQLATPRWVQMDYNGFLSNGTSFTSGLVQGDTFNLQGVIPGFQAGVVGMNVGGQRLIVIPSALGYGSAGNGPVPPNATLVFQVKLDSIQ